MNSRKPEQKLHIPAITHANKNISFIRVEANMPEHLELRQLVGGLSYSDYRSRWIRSCSCSYLGIALATLSSLFFSLCSVIVKGLVDVNPIELASYRFVGVLLPTLPIVLYRQETVFPPGKRIILLLRCFVGTTGLMLSFYAFRHMPLADASVIIFSTPVFVAIFARLFLREPCGTFNVVTIVLTLFGVVLITRPPLLFASSAVPSLDAAASSLGSRMMGTDDAAADAAAAVLSDERAAAAAGGGGLWGPVAALSSTLFGANAYVLLRALKGLHFSVIMTNFGAFALVYTMLVSWWLGALCWPQCGSDRWMVVALAVFSFLGQILLTLSLQLEQAGPVAIARSADIVFAFVWQVLFFGEIPNVYSVAGAVLVVSSVVLTGFRKWALALPRESNVRQRVRWLLMLDK